AGQGQFDALGRAAVEAEALQLAVVAEGEGQLGAGAQAAERFTIARLLQDLVHHLSGNAHRIEQRAEGLARAHLDVYPLVAGVGRGRGSVGQRRQARRQGGVEPVLRLQLRGETGDDRGNQRAKGGEQPRVYAVTPGPAGVEGGGKPFLQLVVQG